MTDQARGEYLASGSSPLALLVDAANAKSQESSRGAGSSLDTNANRDAAGRLAANQIAAMHQMRLGDTEWREALQREALQREALEREAIERELLHRQAALMGYGGFGGFQGIGGQEAEYLHQLHLEALVQQRRQEALAQLAIAHEMGMSPDVHALLQAQQRRQTALLQQEMLLSSGVNPDVLSQDSSIARVVGAQDRTWSEGEQRREETLRKEKYEQQQKLANLSFGGSTVDASAAFLLKAATALSSPDLASSDTNCKGLVAPSIAKDIDKQSSKPKPARLAEDTESRFTMIPCPARGMPSDHNAISAFFKISDDVEHGANLVCSYYACRNSGAQYRYCATCKVPVSKWSFAKLHKHDDAGIPPSAKYKVDAQTILKELIQRNAKEVEQPETQQHQSPSAEEREGEVSIVPEDEKWRLAERQGRWDRLLDSRPRSEEFITDWVQQVLATSDMDSHLDAKNNVQSRTEEDAKVVPHVQLHSELSAAASLRVKREQYADENPRENSELKKNEPDGEDNANDDLANEQNTGENNITEEKESSDFPRTTTINIQTENRGQFDDASDNASTSSEDSVDLRANKRLKAN